MSTTKRSISHNELVELLGETPLAVEVHEGGMFATVVGATLGDGREVIVKAGPPAGSTTLLWYEHDLMKTEVDVLRWAADRPELRMPKLLHVDFSRSVVDVDVFVATKVAGERWDSVQDAMEPQANLRAAQELGRILASIHETTSEVFGYGDRAPELSTTNWPDWFAAMANAALADGRKWGVALDEAGVDRAIEASRASLSQVTVPRLLHADCWRGNVFVDAASGEVTGVIDLERSLWGDPLLDLAAFEPMSIGEPDAVLVASHGGFDLSEAGRIRLDVYRLLFALMMRVEIVPRAYRGDWLAGFTEELEGNIATLLGRLVKT